MWTKNDALTKPGCLSKAADDEPVFILRGQDATMSKMLRHWAHLVTEANGGPNEKTVEAIVFADEVEQWQRSHYHKIPD